MFDPYIKNWNDKTNPVLKSSHYVLRQVFATWLRTLPLAIYSIPIEILRNIMFFKTSDL